MRIAIVSSYSTIGCGVSNYTRELLDELKSTEVEVFWYRVFFNREKLKNAIWIKIFYKIYKVKPDIIHIQYTPTICGPFILVFLFLYKSFRLKAKIVVTAHEKPNVYLKHINKSLRQLFLLYEKNVFKYSNVVIVHTFDHKTELIKKYKLPDKKIAIVPHGVSKRCSLDITREQSIKVKYHLGGRLIITFFGIIRPNKGIEYLIMSFAQLIKKKDDAVLLIAGAAQKASSGYLQELQHLVKRLRIENDVRFTGFIDDEDVSSIIRVSELIVIPYIEVTQSGVLYREVIPYGKPVIVTDIGDMGDIVRRYGIGFVVQPRDVDALSNAMLDLINDEQRINIYRNNAAKINEELSLQNVSMIHIDIYRGLLG